MRWVAVCWAFLVTASAVADEPCLLDDRPVLAVLSNNVGIFPHAVRALYPEKLREKKKEIIADERDRARQYAEAVLGFRGAPDVLLLQEIWSPVARDELIAALREEYPYAQFPRTGDEPALQPSGLLLLSKLPLRDDKFHAFAAGFGLDKLSRKGIAGARLSKDGHDVAVFTTHLQAGGKRDPHVKPAQLAECQAFIREFVGEDRSTVVILAGDFNIDSTDEKAYAEIFARLPGARDSYRDGCGELTRTVRSSDNPRKRLDYLLTFGDREATATIVDLGGPSLTDHLAVFAMVPLSPPR